MLLSLNLLNAFFLIDGVHIERYRICIHDLVEEFIDDVGGIILKNYPIKWLIDLRSIESDIHAQESQDMCKIAVND